jgi:iron(II)-dependent oxidoreductase
MTWTRKRAATLGLTVVAATGALAVAGAGAGGEEEPPPTAQDRPRARAETPPAPARPRPAVPARTALIAGGTYPIGSSAGGDEAPAHRVRLRAFRIDRFEVTNARYARFLNDLGVRPVADAAAGEVTAAAFRPQDAGRFVEGAEGEQRPGLLIALDDEHARIGVAGGRFVAAPAYADHPVAETTWRGADRYARWAGGRLPTEAEWEAAARGREGRTFPWGEAAPTAERAVIGRGSGETAPVGSVPAGATPEGVHDLAGNVDEWTSTLYRPLPYRAGDGREARDPAAGERVTRGGNHVYSSARELRSSFRAGFSRAEDRGHRHIGFRVVHPAGGRAR